MPVPGAGGTVSSRTRELDPHAGLVASYLRELRRSARREKTVKEPQVERWRITPSPANTPRETLSAQR